MSETLRIAILIVVANAFALVAMIFVIRKLLWSDTQQAVNKIKQVEAEVRKKEEAIRREITEHEQEFTRKREDAEADLRRQKEQSEREVSRLKDQVLADARKEGEKIVAQAKKNEENIRQQIAQDMEEKAVDYGGQVFKLVFSEEINQELNKHFVNELLDALEQVDSSAITVDASNAEFTSSHPIATEQKQRLEKLLAEKFNVTTKVEEKVKPDLLAGLVFKLGSLEIDGSLLNRYNEALAEVKKGIRV